MNRSMGKTDGAKIYCMTPLFSTWKCRRHASIDACLRVPEAVSACFVLGHVLLREFADAQRQRGDCLVVDGQVDLIVGKGFEFHMLEIEN